jgi:hypothetical protein
MMTDEAPEHVPPARQGDQQREEQRVLAELAT